MPRFAANLSMMYTEVPFLERFAAAAQDGFEAVEYLFPYEHTPAEIAERLQTHGLTQALFNLPPGDWAGGERGLACLPGREAEFAASVDKAIAYAQATGCKKLHAMAGLVPAGADAQALRATYVTNLRAAAAKLAPLGAQVKAYQAQDQNYADLMNGRLDATLTDKLEAQLNFLTKPEGADFQSGPAIKDPTLPLDIAMGLRKNDAELKALLNKGIAAVLADGTFARIQQKYVGDLDIYNE